MQYSTMFQNRTSCLGRSIGATTHPMVTFRVCRTISGSLSIHIRNLFSKRRSLTANILIPKKQASKCLSFKKTVFFRRPKRTVCFVPLRRKLRYVKVHETYFPMLLVSADIEESIILNHQVIKIIKNPQTIYFGNTLYSVTNQFTF